MLWGRVVLPSGQTNNLVKKLLQSHTIMDIAIQFKVRQSEGVMQVIL